MKCLAAILMMVSLLAMSVTVAAADITRPPCNSQIRAHDLCHAPGLTGGAPEIFKKPGICLVCLMPADETDIVVHRETRVRAVSGAAILPGVRLTVPWRPPRG